MTTDFPSAGIDQAREASFPLGPLEVRPSRREVRAGEASELLEPKVMQVLVALARRAGEVVSRDDLVEACWQGRVVTDDAINRCIARIRRLGEAHAAFEIETVPRVGYRLQASGAAAAPGVAREPLLMVLPFENLSEDPELAFFSDGVSEEIRQALTLRVGLKVIGRASSQQVRDRPAAVAEDLGVSHILAGSVRRAGDRLRISAELVEAGSQTVLWTERFDRRLGDLFAVQDEISLAVAVALNRTLVAARRAAALDPATHDLFLRALDLTMDMRVNSSVLRMLDEVNAAAPDFAAGWALSAQVRQMLRERIATDWSSIAPRRSIPTALRSSRRNCASRPPAPTGRPTSSASCAPARPFRITWRSWRAASTSSAAPAATGNPTSFWRSCAGVNRSTPGIRA